MLRIATLVIALALAGAAAAQEPVGCDKFKWPVERERALLASASAQAKSGDTLKEIPGAARVALRRLDDVSLPFAPERAPRDKASFAGYLRLDVAKPGLYAVALTTNAWIDVIQNGAHLKTVDFSGVGGCEAIRKVVKFQFGAGPLVVQLSGNASPSLDVAVGPAE